MQQHSFAIKKTPFCFRDDLFDPWTAGIFPEKITSSFFPDIFVYPTSDESSRRGQRWLTMNLSQPGSPRVNTLCEVQTNSENSVSPIAKKLRKQALRKVIDERKFD